MPTTIVRYEGTMSLPGAESYARNNLEGRLFRVDKPEFSITVEYARDDINGAERLKYTVDGRPFQTLWRDKKVFAEINSDPIHISFRPPDETMGHNMLGMIFLPKITTMMIQTSEGFYPPQGEPCPTGEAGCETMVIPINPIGVVKYGQWRESRKTLSIDYLGHRFADWIFQFDAQPYPSQLQFREFRKQSTPLAVASYKRVSIETSSRPLKFDESVKDGARMEIMKRGDGYAGQYSGNIQDVWKLYAKQEKIWTQVKQQKSLPYGTIGAVLLGLIAFVGVGIALWRKRAGK